ncbi:hypothetical protein DXT88_21405 [Herbaspirillum lusitanum]|nr:hypothetical protein [Herbaspirillum lusitanum]
MAHSSRVGAEYAVAETRRKAVEHGEKKPPGFADRGLNPIQGRNRRRQMQVIAAQHRSPQDLHMDTLSTLS